MNSARRWPSAKPTRNPHGVKEKEVLFFEGEFPQLHSISFLFPIFYLNLPPPHASVHLPDPHFLDLSHLSLKPSTYPSPRQQNRELFLTSTILPALPQSQSASSVSILFVISFYPLQLIALVPGPFRIVSSDLPCPI